MPFPSANPRKESDVFPGLQSGGHSASTSVGHCVPAGSLPVDVLLQLLVGFVLADDCAFLESRQLSGTFARGRLLEDSTALHVDCRASDHLLAGAGISAGIFSVVLWRKEKRSALSVCDHSVVGELSGAGLRMEDDSRFRWRVEYV